MMSRKHAFRSTAGRFFFYPSVSLQFLCFCTLVVLSAACSDSNRGPQITPVGDQAAVVGEVWELSLAVFDPDGDSLSYRVEGTPATAEVFVVPEGLFFRWAPLASEVEAGGRRYEVRVRATDRYGSDIELSFAIVAYPDGGIPVFISPPGYVLDLSRSDRVSFTVQVKDDDSAQLDFEVLQDLPGASWTIMSDRSRSVTWIPSQEQIAERKYWSLIVGARDETNPMVLQTISVVLSNAHVLRDCSGSWPWVESMTLNVSSGDGVDIYVEAEDPESSVQLVTAVWQSYDANGNTLQFGASPLSPLGDGDFAGSIEGFELGAPEALVFEVALRVRDDDDVDSSLCDHEIRYPKEGHRSVLLNDSMCPEDSIWNSGSSVESPVLEPGSMYQTRLCLDGPRTFLIPVGMFSALSVAARSLETETLSLELDQASSDLEPEKAFGEGDILVTRYPMGEAGQAEISLSSNDVQGIASTQFFVSLTDEPCEPDSFEPDNKPSQALLKGLASSESRVLCPADRDYIRVVLDDFGILKVRVIFDHRDGDLDIEIFGEDGSTLLRRAQSRAEDEKLEVGLPAGAYYVLIHAGAPSAAIPYVLDMSIDYPGTCYDDVFAPNNSTDDARVLPAMIFDNLVLCPGAQDHFGHISNDDESYQVVAQSLDPGIDLELAILNESGAILTSGQNSVDTAPLSAGRYNIRVRSQSQSLIPYSLQFSLDSQGLACQDRFGENKSPETAPLLSEGWTTRVSLCAGEKDYFAIRTSGPKELRLIVEHPSVTEPLFLHYVDDAGKVLASSINQGSYGVLDTALPTAATHYFFVDGAFGQVHYDLWVEYP